MMKMSARTRRQGAPERLHWQVSDKEGARRWQGKPNSGSHIWWVRRHGEGKRTSRSASGRQRACGGEQEGAEARVEEDDQAESRWTRR